MYQLKNFKFSLDVLLRVKKAEQKKIDYEIHKTNQKRLHLRQELNMLEEKLCSNNLEYETRFKEGVDIHHLRHYFSYADRLSKMKRLQVLDIEAINEEIEKLREKYIALKKELDVLEELRLQQFKAYKHDMAQKQADELEDIISYKTSRGAGNGGI